MVPVVTDPSINLRVFAVRGQRVVLDTDLSTLYGAATKIFNQTIRRNADRFPADFVFQLTREEFARLKSQTVLSNPEGLRRLRSQFVTLKAAGRGRHRKYLPLVFTKHGAIMAAMLLRSERAVAMSVYVVRAFVRMREELTTSAVILRRLAEIDKKLLIHDVVLRDIYEKLRPLLRPPPDRPRKQIGFHAGLRRL
ncbi:MAG TPA: ORF6N domain-containing protein [Opitutaceae bacterium]|nr:ORF6N domain-containing protein [Opitutaceae bacterium]